MKSSFKVIFLILIHLFLFNILFCLRISPQEAYRQRLLYEKGVSLKKTPLDYLKLYFSKVTDEAYYYEWSSVVLGKPLEADYPFYEREESPVKKYFSQIPQPRMPYRDIEFEYPPVLILPLIAARLLSHDYLSFTRALAFLISLAYLGSLWATYRIWRKIPSEKKFSWPEILVLSALSVFTLGQIYVTRLDVFPSLLCLLALHSFLSEKYRRASLWIVLGTFTKAYPLLLGPLFGLQLLHQKKYRELLFNAALIMVLLMVLSFGLGIWTDGKYWESYRFHFSRGVQIESLYALIPFLAHWIFNEPVRIYIDHNCHNIHMPHHLNGMIQFSGFISLALFSIVYGLFFRNLRKIQEKYRTNLVLNTGLLLILGFILTFKVLSPQFLTWLTPLIFLTDPRKKKAFFSVFILMLLLTQILFPSFFSYLYEAHPAGIGLLLARNLLLVVLFGWLFKDSFRRTPENQEPSVLR